jgi:hypothetical protein
MKKSALFILTIVIIFGACAKKSADDTTAATLQVSQTTDAHIGQPVTFILPSVASTAVVSWSVTPNKATVSTSGNSASVVFQSSGKYTVTGTSGSSTGSSSFSVDTVQYLPPNGTTTVAFNTSEQLNITVKRADSTTASSGLTFTMQTAGSYSCLNSVLAFTANNGAGGAATYTIDVTGIKVPLGGCASGSSKASGTATTKIPLPVGTTTLTINFNGTVYTGNIQKTGNAYVISWSYTSGVLVSPLSL